MHCPPTASHISTCRPRRNGSGTPSSRLANPLLSEAPAKNERGPGDVPVPVFSGNAMIVYGSMDRQALDAAYNNSAAVADSDRYLADWLHRSEALRLRMPDHLNLVYGDAPRARLDFFATNRTAAPTLLFFHVAVAGYTLSPEARMDGIVREARTALRWLHQHLAALGSDPARLYVGGWSAGGHLD